MTRAQLGFAALMVILPAVIDRGPVASAQTTLTWTGAGGNSNWSNVSNWGGVNYPNNGQPTAGATYNAIINSGSQTLDTAVTINNLTYASSGTLGLSGGGSPSLTVNGLFNWSAGTISIGLLTLNGGGSVTGGSETLTSTLAIGNASTVTFSSGTSTWSGSAGTSGTGTASFTGATALFNAAIALASPVSLSNGTFDGTGAMTISGPFTWSGGNLGAQSSPGAGTTTLTGGATISNSPLLNRTLINANGSAVQMIGTASINTAGNASWMNQSGSSFTFTSDGGLAGTGTFTNAAGAIFQKTGGTNTSGVNFAFTNNGTINDTSGTLNFTTTFVQNGAITVGSGANVLFNNSNATWTWTGTASTSGTGTVTFSGVPTNFNGTNTLASPTTLSFGTVDGSGTLTISGPLTWGGNTMGALSSPGAGTSIISGGANIVSGVSINRPVMNASGSNVLMAGGGVTIYGNGTWSNQSGSIFTFASDNSITFGATGCSFINAAGATVQKTVGINTSNFAVPFTNNGTVSVTSGTLAINGTTDTQNGAITVGANATLAINGGTSTWTGTSSAIGAGTFVVNTTVFFNGTNTISAPFTFQNGTIDGTGAVTVSSFFSWPGGNLGASSSPGAGTTTLTGGAIIGNVNLNRSVINASGSAVQVYGTISSLSANAVWTNQAGSSFSWGNDGALNANTGSFVNQAGAIYQKISGSGTSEATWSFTNAGTVNASSGTLRFDVLPNLVSGTLNAGAWNVAAGATLLFIPGNVTTIGANAAVSLTGPGSTFAALDTHLATNAGSLSILGGRAFTPNGTLTNTGSLIVGQTTGDGSQFTGSITTGSGGTMRGTGSITGTATLGSGSTLAPGTATIPGSLAAGAWVFQSGGSYLLKYNPATNTPVAGTDNDTITSSAGTLNLAGLSAGSPFTVKLQPDSSATPFGGSVTYVAGAFTSPIVLPAGVTSANLTTLFTFTGSYSGTPTASLDATQDKIQFTFTPVAATPPGALTWTGSSSGNWSNGGNWNPATAPTSAANNQLTFGATSNATMVNDIAGTLTLNSLTFNGSSPTYALSGNGLNFQTNSSAVLPQIVTNSANNVTVSNAITLTNGVTVSGSGRITLSGNVGGAGSLTYSGTGMLTLSGTNSYSGGTTVNSGTLGIVSDLALGNGGLTLGSFATLEYTATTATTKSYALAGSNLAVASGQTVTLNGSQISGGFLSGPGIFATNAVSGAHFANLTIQPSAKLNFNSGSDYFFNSSNGGTLNIAANIPATTPVVFAGLTNQGSGAITVAASSQVNASDFQTYGTLTLAPGTGAAPTQLTNAGQSELYFNGGSRTFLSVPANAGQFDAGIDLHGNNAVVAGGLFVNNGYVVDSIGAGTKIVIADFGSLVKGAGFYQNSVQTVNGGKFQSGNSPGQSSFGSFDFGPGGVSNYVFAIDDATGTAGPSPDVNGQVSGWGLVKAVHRSVGSVTTPGDFTWTATATNKLTVSLDTLVNPTTVGADVAGPMADFDPTKPYAWLAASWTGNYTGPTDPATLDAATAFDVSGFANPFAGNFGWSLDADGHTLSLTYSPSAVPEPGTLALTCLAGLGLALLRRQRRECPDGSALP